MALKQLPVWSNKGVEPPEYLRVNGFAAGYKPPASYFNWFWSSVIDCINELQSASTLFDISIPTTGWVADSASGLYRYEFSNANVTADDVVDINLDLPSLTIAEECVLKPVTESLDQIFYIYAESVPTATMNGTAVIKKRTRTTV